MWRTNLPTCRTVLLTVLCGSVIPAGAGILGLQMTEPHGFIGPAMEQVPLDLSDSAGHVSSSLPGDHPLPASDAGLSAGMTSGDDVLSAYVVNPGGYPPTGFSLGSGLDDLVTALHTDGEDPAADVQALRVGVQGRQIVGAAGGQSGDEFVRRAPVPGAALLAAFGLGAVGLSWRRFA